MSRQDDSWDTGPEAATVLLVEDNPGDARLLQEMLKEATAASFPLVWVERLSAALERLAAGGIDVVLLDLTLPDSHGLDTLARMQARAPRLPIIVLTGLNDEALAVQAVRKGAQDYLIKGQVDADLLIRAVRYAIARKRVEQALLVAAQQWRDTFDAIGDAVFLLDADGRIVRCNKAMANLVGKSFNEIIGRACWELVHGLHEPVQGCPFLRVRESRRRESSLSRIGESWFDSTVDPMLDEDGDVSGAVHILSDITDRKRAEEEKTQLQAQLVHAQKMQAVGTLAGGIAHEFNNINGEIIAFIDLTLEMDELPSVVRRNLEAARDSAVAGASLTKSLLSFSRKDVGEKNIIPLRHVVDQVLRVTEKQLACEGISVTVNHAMGVPFVRANASMLESVVMNLVINARHAMLKSEAKRLTIETDLKEGRPLIRVEDTGCGIAEKDIGRVFEPFFTTKGALASGEVYDGKAHGTGLGLSVCHTIIEGHGGELTVNSQGDRGTTFTVYLPACTAVEGDDAHHGVITEAGSIGSRSSAGQA